MVCFLAHVVYAAKWSRTPLPRLSSQLLGVAVEDHCPWCDRELFPLFQQDISYFYFAKSNILFGNGDISYV